MPTNREAFSNVIWRLLERFGAQTVTFFVSLVLARLLDAEIYGTVALVMVFITILQVFVDSGLGNALIQKKNADDLDFSTVFIFNIAVCSGLYCLLFLFSPIIARFYKNPDLTSVIRVLGLILIISGVKNVQQAYVSRNMLFKKFFFSTLGGTLGAAVFGVFLAYKGYGIWALVGQYLFNNTVDMLILWITVGWRPHLNFSFIRLKGLFSYGWKLLVSTLLNVGINDLNSLVIGKVYAPSSLGFYENGKKIPAWTMSNIASAIDSVLFPSMSAEQDNKERLKVMTSRSIKTTTYALMPMLMGLAVCSEPLIRILLTEKWIQSVFYLRVFCFVFAFYPIHTANLYVIKDIDAWTPQIRSKTAIRSAKKHIFVDPSLALAALGLSPRYFNNDLDLFGHVFENLVIRDLLVYAQAHNAKVMHYTDDNGLEADAVYQLEDGRYALIEIKTGTNEIPKAEKGLLKFRDIIQEHNKKAMANKEHPGVIYREPTLLIVICGNATMAYTTKAGVRIIPIGCLKD